MSGDRSSIERRQILKTVGLTAAAGVGAAQSVGATPNEETPERVRELREEYDDVATARVALGRHAAEVPEHLREQDRLDDSELSSLADEDDELLPAAAIDDAAGSVREADGLASTAIEVDGTPTGLVQLERETADHLVRIVALPELSRGYAVVYDKATSPRSSRRRERKDDDGRTDGIRYVVDHESDGEVFTQSDCEVIDTWCTNDYCHCNSVAGIADEVNQTCCDTDFGTTCYPDIDDCGCSVMFPSC